MKDIEKDLDCKKLSAVLKEFVGFEKIRDYSIDEIHFKVEYMSSVEKNWIHGIMFFIKEGIILLEKLEHKRYIEFFKYQDVSDAKIYDVKNGIKLKIFVKNSKYSVFLIRNRNLAQKVVAIIKTRIDSKYSQNEKTDIEKGETSAVIRFSDLNFVISYDQNCSMQNFMRKAISRLGQHFYPKENIYESLIDVSKYKKFSFYLNYKNKYILLENDSDLKSAIKFFNKKLDVSIFVEKDRKIQESSNIRIDFSK